MIVTEEIIVPGIGEEFNNKNLCVVDSYIRISVGAQLHRDLQQNLYIDSIHTRYINKIWNLIKPRVHINIVL